MKKIEDTLDLIKEVLPQDLLGEGWYHEPLMSQ